MQQGTRKAFQIRELITWYLKTNGPTLSRHLEDLLLDDGSRICQYANWQRQARKVASARKLSGDRQSPWQWYLNP